MLRIVSAALRGTSRAASLQPRSIKCKIPPLFITPDVQIASFASQAQYLSLPASINRNNVTCNTYSTLFSQPGSSTILSPSLQVDKVPVRTLTKFSRRKGKRKSVKAVIHRFYRLDWGMWIRTKAGRHKKLWKKSWKRKGRLARHVMTTAKQSHLLDVMVTKYWRRDKHYVDDPYNPYHRRDSFFITRRKPQEIA